MSLCLSLSNGKFSWGKRLDDFTMLLHFKCLLVKTKFLTNCTKVICTYLQQLLVFSSHSLQVFNKKLIKWSCCVLDMVGQGHGGRWVSSECHQELRASAASWPDPTAQTHCKRQPPFPVLTMSPGKREKWGAPRYEGHNWITFSDVCRSKEQNPVLQTQWQCCEHKTSFSGGRGKLDFVPACEIICWKHLLSYHMCIE